MALYFGWGLLLGQLAACHAYWKVRLHEWHLVSIPIAVLASFLVYWLLLRAIGVRLPFIMAEILCWLTGCNRSKRNDAVSHEPSHKTSDEVCYSWTNVNPVHVLKSQYCPDLIGNQDPSVFYHPGKEYLQISEGRRDQILSGNGFSLEMEGLGCICVPTAWQSELVPTDLEDVGAASSLLGSGTSPTTSPKTLFTAIKIAPDADTNDAPDTDSAVKILEPPLETEFGVGRSERSEENKKDVGVGSGARSGDDKKEEAKNQDTADIDLAGGSESKKEDSLTKAEKSDAVGTELSTDKAEVPHQSRPSSSPPEPSEGQQPSSDKHTS